MLSDDLLREAVKFHGHFGPFLVIGLRAGLIGIDFLGQDPFMLRATIVTALHPPRSCFIDGIQFASGCTVGKNNLEVRAGNTVSVEFKRGERKIRLILRDGILKQLDHLRSEERVEMSAKEVFKMTDEELFLIERD
jgi:formylmethanofuran dehydrogenase subunit E